MTVPPFQLIQQLLDLQNKYARTPRAIVTGERLEYALSRGANINIEEAHIREKLLEHVGHLPVIAAFLHTHLEHREKVNLGRSLIMLAVHDIGETITGDVLTYHKSDKQSEEENAIAKTLLPKEFIPYFDEFELRETFDAKYAKSVDAIAPLLHELDMPNLTRNRFQTYGFNSTNIRTKKRKLFEWDNSLLQLFESMTDAYRKIERGEPTGFKTIIDLP